MKIAVLGAGAMGGLFSGYLSTANDVTVIDVNSELVAAIDKDGLRIREPEGTERVYRPAAVKDTKDFAPVDLVVIFVKSMFSQSALQANKSIIGPNTYLMTLQNGSGHEDVLLQFVDRAHIIIGTTQHNASVLSSAEVYHGGSGHTTIGCLTGDLNRLQPIADAFSASGIAASVSADVQKMIWSKMFTNVTASALTGALQVPLGFIVQNEHAWKMCQMLLQEAVAAANADGMGFVYEETLAAVRAVCENAPNGLTSIYADLRDGRKSEVDTISGSVLKAGRRNGTPTPSHAFLVQMIHAMETKTKD